MSHTITSVDATLPKPGATGMLIAAAVVFALFSTSAQAQPVSDVYAEHGSSPAFGAKVNYVSNVAIPVPGRVRANWPAAVTGAQRSLQRPVVVEAPVTGREWAERQGRAGISAGY